MKAVLFALTLFVLGGCSVLADPPHALPLGPAAPPAAGAPLTALAPPAAGVPPTTPVLPPATGAPQLFGPTPNVPTCQRVDATCNMYAGVNVCFDTCKYRMTNLDGDDHRDGRPDDHLDGRPDDHLDGRPDDHKDGRPDDHRDGRPDDQHPLDRPDDHPLDRPDDHTLNSPGQRPQGQIKCDFMTLRCEDGTQLTGCKGPDTAYVINATCGRTNDGRGDGSQQGAAAPPSTVNGAVPNTGGNVLNNPAAAGNVAQSGSGITSGGRQFSGSNSFIAKNAAPSLAVPGGAKGAVALVAAAVGVVFAL